MLTAGHGFISDRALRLSGTKRISTRHFIAAAIRLSITREWPLVVGILESANNRCGGSDEFRQLTLCKPCFGP
jgi:hypothetical protein